MDSLTQIVLGASVGEAIAGKKLGNKAALWGAIAGTIPDLDVIVRGFVNPIDGALLHRGFSHSIVFAVLAAPILGWLVHLLYKRKYELHRWKWLFFGSIVTHPMLDIFTSYGTQFFWPFELRWTFNSVFVIDPLYTLPFGILLLIALFLPREKPLRRKLNRWGLIYSSLYLVWCVGVKLTILHKSDAYFARAGIKGNRTMVTPMPFTSFYWMMLSEDATQYHVAYKSIFYEFDSTNITTIPKKHEALNALKWKGKNYAKTLAFLSNGYYSAETRQDTVIVYDLRFGLSGPFTNNRLNVPVFTYGMVIDNGFVKKTMQLRPQSMWNHVNFGNYFQKITHP